MKDFCPYCERETELIHIQKIEEIKVKGENIPVKVDRFRCTECNEEFDNPSPSYDPLAEAYHEYRHRKGMVQPEQIRMLREKYNLSQKELGALLGFGGATISRYENGSLQDEAHDTILKLIQNPLNLQTIIESKSDLLDEIKQRDVRERINRELQNTASTYYARARSTNFLPGPLNGFSKISLTKVLSAVKILVHGKPVYKSKLNKLLFYADFKYFQLTKVSLTGLSYKHLPYGPVPDGYELLYEALLDLDPDLKKDERTEGECSGEVFSYANDPEAAGLSLSEIQTILKVKEFFSGYTSIEIEEYSHKETAYKATSQGSYIPYPYAKDLRI